MKGKYTYQIIILIFTKLLYFKALHHHIHTKTFQFIVTYQSWNTHRTRAYFHTFSLHTNTSYYRYITPVFIYIYTFNWLLIISYNPWLQLWLLSRHYDIRPSLQFNIHRVTTTKNWLHFNDFILKNKKWLQFNDFFFKKDYYILTSVGTTCIYCSRLLLRLTNNRWVSITIIKALRQYLRNQINVMDIKMVLV